MSAKHIFSGRLKYFAIIKSKVGIVIKRSCIYTQIKRVGSKIRMVNKTDKRVYNKERKVYDNKILVVFYHIKEPVYHHTSLQNV